MINVPTLASLRRAQSGFTLIEVLVASFVLMVGAMSAFALIDRANGATNRVRTSDNATNLARELIEGARSVPYEKVSSPGVIAELQALPGLQDIDGGAYTIRRNGTTYSVSVDVCIMDDPKDGGGPRPTTATFCANSAPTGTADKNPEDYKRVTVSVSWTEQGRTRVLEADRAHQQPGQRQRPGDPLAHAGRLHRAVRGHDRRQRGHLGRHDVVQAGHDRLAARRHPPDRRRDAERPDRARLALRLEHEDARRRRLRGRRRGVRRLRRLRAGPAGDDRAQPLRAARRPSR